MLLSICLAVYNQLELVRKNIATIVTYHGDDIEIVVSDDCSSEPIYEMVSSFHDSRIRYCKTIQNKSHDGNILNGLRNCKGDYIFLFRSRDIIVPSKIRNVLDTIKEHPRASYFLFSALDECYKARMDLSNYVYKRGVEAALAHDKLLVHPSGQIYKRSSLRLDLYEKYIDAYFPQYNGCDVHQLIRMDLAWTGDFVTSSCRAWRYAYTAKAGDKSVIKTKGKINIYAPYYQYPRCACEMNFVDKELPKESKIIFLKQIISAYAWRIVPMFLSLNQDKAINRHYGSKQLSFSPYRELIEFNRRMLELIEELDFEKKWDLKKSMWKALLKTAFYDIPKVYIRKILNKT